MLDVNLEKQKWKIDYCEQNIWYLIMFLYKCTGLDFIIIE